MIEVRKYTADEKANWDKMLAFSKADTFLFYRDFMDYHSDRFRDNSFMIYRKGKLEALLPGNISGNIFYSHQGLTYGGLISTLKIATDDVIQSFKTINKILKADGITEVIYKPLPTIYHHYPSQEDIYALFRLGAEKIGCNLSSTIFQNNKSAFNESRKSGVRKAQKEGVLIKESENFSEFWKVLEINLLKLYEKKPVHSLDEIIFLKSKFPNNIKLYNCLKDNKVIGGCLLFIMKNIVHVQYISANDTGKSMGAIDLLFDKLINDLYHQVPIFDFGHSTENMGNLLNENLIFQKEGFGGRGIAYDIYKYKI